MSNATTTVYERPILFSGPMVKAILEGRKTQTRRIMKPQPPLGWSIPPARFIKGYMNRYGCHQDKESISCPFHEGMRLWVRETTRLSSTSGYGSETTHVRLEYRVPDRDHVRVREFKQPDPGPYDFDRWTPSIHMPRWASRLTLEITEVRVQRLQEISEEDAKAEGIRTDILPACGDHPDLLCYVSEPDDNHAYRYAREAFAKTWDVINGKCPGCSWEANPFVWVIGFRRIDPAPQQEVYL